MFDPKYVESISFSFTGLIFSLVNFMNNILKIVPPIFTMTVVFTAINTVFRTIGYEIEILYT